MLDRTGRVRAPSTRAISSISTLKGDGVTAAAILEIRDISKSFGAIKALTGVDFTLQRGEIHALCGENGAKARSDSKGRTSRSLRHPPRSGLA